MNTKISLLAVVLSSSCCGVSFADLPLPPLPSSPDPLARMAQKSELPPVPVAPKEAVAPPSDDEFTESLAALRKELEGVRAVRQQTAGTGGGTGDFDGALSAVRQRRQLLDMLQKLATSGPKKNEARQTQRTDKKTEMTDENEAAFQLDIGDKVNDPFGLGKTLYKLGDFVRAEQAFRRWPTNGNNEWLKKYLIASCLRKQNKLPEAITLYQEVILNSSDNVLQESAKWQLSNMRWKQQMDSQIKRLRDLQQKPDVDANDSTDGQPAAAPAPQGT